MTTRTGPAAPARLRDAIARDLKPTRPLWTPAQRALALAPIALATIVAVPVLHFFRADMRTLGFGRTWGLSLVEALAGLVVVAVALRESVPGRELSAGAAALWFAAGAAVPVLVFAATARSLDVGPPAGGEWSDGVVCFRTSAAAALPSFVVVTLFVARALPLRPAIAGGLYGLGCGLVADAGLRLYCDFTVLGHVVFAHGGAVVLSVIAGVLIARTRVR